MTSSSTLETTPKESQALTPPDQFDFITRWDLDKTYLRTEFDTLSDLVRTALERPDQKRSVPGAASLLRELGQTGARVHILSGSPRQMRARLEEKLRIDRVRWNLLTLKPNLSNALRLRFRAMRDQLGYKLPVLLAQRVLDQRRDTEGPLPEILVGDDAEADAFVYSLYSDVCSGEVDSTLLRKTLSAGKLYSDQLDDILSSASQIRCEPVTERILIHLDRQSPPSRFDRYGGRVVPFYNYLQATFVLAEGGRIGANATLRIAEEFALRHRFEPDALSRSYYDLMRRGHVSGALHAKLFAALEHFTSNAKTTLQKMCELMASDIAHPPEPAVRHSTQLDYIELAKKHRGGKNRKKRR